MYHLDNIMHAKIRSIPSHFVDLCNHHAYFDGHIKECNVPYSSSDEDEASYAPGWYPTNATSGLFARSTRTRPGMSWTAIHFLVDTPFTLEVVMLWR